MIKIFKHTSLYKRFGDDLGNIIWLIILYLFQGIPLGLTFGTIPFLLHKHSTYTQIGIFSLTGFPYSLKILWSPFVDSYYFKSFGRRKSWIVPIQLLAGSMFLVLANGNIIDDLIEHSETEIIKITLLFGSFVVMMATQDIAVDGWALTILSKANVHLASTCQNIGLSTGFFLSYTVYLALSSAEFSNKYIRPSSHYNADVGIITLSSYLYFWGLIYIVFSIILATMKNEERTNQSSTPNGGSPKLNSSTNKKLDDPQQQQQLINNNESMNLQQQEDDEMEETDLKPIQIYQYLWKIISLPHIRTLSMMFLLSKVVFQSNESALSLRLLELGMKKEDLASFSIFQFPCTILFSIVAGKLIRDNPLTIWTKAYFFGVVFVFLNMLSVVFFQKGWFFYFILLLLSTCSSFMSTLMSVGQGGFFLKISEKNHHIGGTYLTFLNTIANLGGTWPKFLILTLIDKFTSTQCVIPNGVIVELIGTTDEIKSLCNDEGGEIVTTRDGYFTVTIILVVYGLIMHRILTKKMIPIEKIKPSSFAIAKGE
ncbi:putative acetyl-CoA transporter [Cavenderia fasciculata]|uniref:Acetyl-CoA transporter n=1 Tax=Cavenderia fasciculata TaxID=261658 RepID=F4PHE4_CACFS|nr:putative acetyl-CoA transporter [Cavenderia fasciculata]EGG25128.1 putative acetyl-CoA transporter [Cavenderia fasciculata]|eukprot:XP_004362979.1 putative acetyl-CoA transporter [Cavenderia fasciculata]